MLQARSFAALAFLALVACSSDDETSSSSSGGSSSGSTSSSGSGTECTSQEQCPKLTCTCDILANAEVQRCSNGVCAKSCAEAGCK